MGGGGGGECINPVSECVIGRDQFFGLGLGTDVELKEPSIMVPSSSQLYPAPLKSQQSRLCIKEITSYTSARPDAFAILEK